MEAICNRAAPKFTNRTVTALHPKFLDIGRAYPDYTREYARVHRPLNSRPGMKSHSGSRRPKYLVVTQSKQLRCRTSALTVCLLHCGTAPALCARALVPPPPTSCAHVKYGSILLLGCLCTRRQRDCQRSYIWYHLVGTGLSQNTPLLYLNHRSKFLRPWAGGQGTLSRCMSLAVKD